MEQERSRVDPRYHTILSLPDISISPPFTVDGDGTCLALIPVFYEQSRNIENILPFAKAALYSRCSCLRFTDAVAEKVSVKLFVEWSARETLLPLFKDNQIDEDRDIFYFSALPVPDTQFGIWAYLTKKHENKKNCNIRICFSQHYFDCRTFEL